MEAISFSLHHHWTKGIMPNEGGLDDQANLYGPLVLAVERGVVEGRNRLEEIAHRKAKAKNTSGGNGPKHTSKRPSRRR